MKDTTKLILEKLGTDNKGFESAKEFGLLEEGSKVSKGKNLFDRLDVDEELVKLHDKNNALIQERLADKKEEEPAAEEEAKPEIAYEDFTKLNLVVGKIIEANDHPNADKLLVFKVDIGSEIRTIVSGIKKWYKAEDLIGKNVIVVKNLAPRKMRGIESQGMLLAADFGEDLTMISTLADIKPGSKVS